MSVLVFEDERWENFLPLTLTRHVSQQLLGTKPILDHVAGLFDETIALAGRGYLSEVVGERTGLSYNAELEKEVFIVNGRLNPLVDIRKMIAEKSDFALMDHGDVVVATVDGRTLAGAMSKDGTFSQRALASVTKGLETLEATEPMLFYYPWEVLYQNDRAIVAAAGKRTKTKVSPRADVEDHVSFDTRGGPVLVEAGARVESFSRVSGPCYIGKDAVVHSGLIRGGTTIGDNCRVGGEVEHSIIYANTNKAHFGYLGHSVVGEWVNLGAGSVTSNLKNTYGTIKVVRKGERVDTGVNKLGAMFGDMSKISIGTLVYGGKTTGVSSHSSGLVDKDVPDFTHYDGNEKREFALRLESVIQTQSRVMPRRDEQMTEAQRRLIQYLYALTVSERKVG
jgi:UDP-N-acetylglucosamine diphosphorylase / glucose-1-phosphate thymidylyltransferase / UDP-N-acetylgalactosamine diphosphorylase / glucosamine-1-phosphate N-acetyltransferase / galactosamine-1-phosphate N-acetyltransferase